MSAADDRHDLHAAMLKPLRHLDRHDIAAARRNHERGVLGRQVEVPQDPLGQAAHVFQEHRLPLAVRADDEVVKAQREFDDRIETGERAVARPHLLDHDAAMAGAEDVDHAARENAFREPVRRLRDRIALALHLIDDRTAFAEIIGGGRHAQPLS